MSKPAYLLHPEAAENILAIWNYIAFESLTGAKRVREDIMQALSRLARYPYLGHPREDLTGRPLRFMNVGQYLIAYAPHEVPIWVIAVIHGRRSPRIMAAILRSREEPPTQIQ